jgi:hypothetical protein
MSDSTYPITTDLSSEVQITTEFELEDWVDNAIKRYQDYPIVKKAILSGSNPTQ